MNKAQLLKHHGELTGAARKLMVNKNHDYAGAGGEDPFRNFRLCEQLSLCSVETGMLVRLCDKLSRLATFAKSGRLLVADEGVQDTCLDVVNYIVLLSAFIISQDDEEPRQDKAAGDRLISCNAQGYRATPREELGG